MGGKDPQKVGLNYDEVMDYIGQFGRFQRKIFLWLSLVSAAAGLAVVVFAFTAFVPKYRQGSIKYSSQNICIFWLGATISPTLCHC